MFFAPTRPFDQRSRRIVRRSRKLAMGAEAHIRQDGLIVARPRRRGTALPWQGLAILVSLFLVSKAAMLVQLGAITYGERLELLASGTWLERAGATLMQPDPVTLAVAETLRSLFAG